MAHRQATFWALCLFLIRAVSSITVDFTDQSSIIAGASEIAYGMMSYYKGNDSGQTPGLLPYPPYFWWESGAMFGVLIDYWIATGDATYNDVVSQGLLFQTGNNNDFMPLNQTFDMGNDDQAFWALSALTAAESNFQNPPANGPSWLGLAQAVYNEQIGRWDNTTCNGGLHWQVYPTAGYHLKNTISNGALMQIAARLARYTKNDEYAQWAIKLWDWMWAVGLIDNNNWSVYDNTDSNNNCTTVDRAQWTYNAATLIIACSTMYNYTNGSEIWANRTSHLLSTAKFDFFPNGIMTELCESTKSCDTDELTFKAYLSRWMAITVQMAPFTEATIMPILNSSAVAAMKQCDGTFFPNNCGLRWSQNSTWDGTNGPGQQMAALEVLLSTIIKVIPAPLTNSTGGTSISDPSAGTNTSNSEPGSIVTPPTNGDRVGAWIVTALVLVASVASCYFMWSTSFEVRPDMYNNKPLGPASAPIAKNTISKPNYRLSMVGALAPGTKIESAPIHYGGRMAT